MKVLKNSLLALLLILLILSPVIFTFSAILITPKTFENTIYGELDDKFERLTSITDDKIIVIGGSSVAFGLDSRELERQLGMPVVNFGLYAAIGTKAMLDLSLAGVSEGDVVVLAPELDSQTMSTYFSAEHILPAIDENYAMAGYLDKDDLLLLLGGSFDHAVRKLSLRNNIPDPKDIYNKKSFNEYGDIKEGIRPSNAMQLYYDPNTPIDLSKEIVSADFIDYLNEYIAECEGRGATVYFSYCPMNDAALKDGVTEKSAKSFESFLKKNINCDFISNINDYILDKAYFYDTNYHLNDTGVLLRTALLSQDLLIALGVPRLVDTNIAPPPLPEVDVKYFGDTDENARYFTYEKLPNGAYMITGLTEEGKGRESLTLPLGYDGYKVTAIGKEAFKDSALRKLTVTEDTSLRSFIDGAFSGSSVTDIYIYYDFTKQEDKLSPCADFGGKMRIHVRKSSAFTTHYDWLDSSGGYVFVTDID